MGAYTIHSGFNLSLKPFRVMKRFKYFCGVALLLLCLPAHATLISASDTNYSWTSDTGAGLDWLDFDGGNAVSTIGRSYNTVSAQLGIGGDYEGWRYATIQEVLKFIFNASGVTYSTSQYLTAYNGVTDAVASWMGYTNVISNSNGLYEYVYGFVADDCGYMCTYSVNMFDPNNVLWTDRDFMSISSGFDIRNPYGGYGSWLTRDYVASTPEPSTLVLMSIGLLGLGFSRRKRL